MALRTKQFSLTGLSLLEISITRISFRSFIVQKKALSACSASMEDAVLTTAWLDLFDLLKKRQGKYFFQVNIKPAGSAFILSITVICLPRHVFNLLRTSSLITIVQ